MPKVPVCAKVLGTYRVAHFSRRIRVPLSVAKPNKKRSRESYSDVIFDLSMNFQGPLVRPILMRDKVFNIGVGQSRSDFRKKRKNAYNKNKRSKKELMHRIRSIVSTRQ